MNRKSPFDFTWSLARISIWTIVHHHWLAAQIRFYIWCACATVLFLSLASLIPLSAALIILLASGMGLLILLWSLIHWRRSILLSIRDEDLRQQAYEAMLALIRSKPNSALKAGSPWRWSKRKLRL